MKCVFAKCAVCVLGHTLRVFLAPFRTVLSRFLVFRLLNGNGSRLTVGSNQRPKILKAAACQSARRN